MLKLPQNKTGSKFELAMRFSWRRNLRPLSFSLAQEQPGITDFCLLRFKNSKYCDMNRVLDSFCETNLDSVNSCLLPHLPTLLHRVTHHAETVWILHRCFGSTWRQLSLSKNFTFKQGWIKTVWMKYLLQEFSISTPSGQKFSISKFNPLWERIQTHNTFGQNLNKIG